MTNNSVDLYRCPRHQFVIGISGAPTMMALPKDKLSILRDKIVRQRTTVNELKQAGHECPDAERELKRMIGELQTAESLPRASQPSHQD
jgi:hypothetical protein